METLNSSHSTNSSSDNASIFADSPYTTAEIVIIILVAGSLSLVTVVGNILVMLSIKVGASLPVAYQHCCTANVFQLFGFLTVSIQTKLIVLDELRKNRPTFL